MPPLTAARAVMAAKATSLAGAAVAGLWIGLLLYVLPSWSMLVAAQSDGITGIIGLVGAAIMIGGALFLEHCLPGADRSGSTEPGASTGSSRRPRTEPAPQAANSRWRGDIFGLTCGGLDRTGDSPRSVRS